MSDLILHHYDVSPYAEKIRLALGLKGLAWKSVKIPVVMPKPDLTALTGGYRLTPVLQIGADIYCDTRRIASAIDALHPTPRFFPAGRAARCHGLAHWAETIFMNAIVLYMGKGSFPQDFVDDRKTMIPGGFDPEAARSIVPAKRDQIRAKLDVLEQQLAGAEPWLMGGEASIADLAAYHPLWALRVDPELSALLAPFPSLLAWMDRVAAIGHGTPTEIASQEAVEIARAATPRTRPAEDPGDPNGRKPGDRIRILPEDYGMCPVEGEFVTSDAQGIALGRSDDRVGDVVVHFPREGYLTF